MSQTRWSHRLVPLALAVLLAAAGSAYAGHISITEFAPPGDEFVSSEAGDQLVANPADALAGVFDQDFAADLAAESSGSVNFSAAGIMVASTTTAVIPEPGTYVLLGLGALGVLLAGRRRRKQ